ncbi:MAG: DUF1565 domain-containing protein, partial [Anaerolineae bacterium]|nr:DUF1565 domain-containing protein [Anaerolineae bacterium]
MTTMKAYSWPRLLPLLGALALAFLLLGLLSLSVTGLPAARAAGTVRYVAATGNDTGNDCANSAAPCATVQHAVDVAAAGDEIRVAAGTYTGVWGRPKPVGYPGPDVITQSVYVSKTVIVRGGYTTANWTTSDPAANQTALDAEGQGRVMVIANNISPTVEGLRITGGNATGLRGWRYSSAGAGGGIYVRSASPIISNCAIYSNTGDIL